MTLTSRQKIAVKHCLGSKMKEKIQELDRRSLVPLVRSNRLTYLSDSKLCVLLESINEINDLGVKGCFIEAGVALGGSLVIISGNCESRDVLAYDTFEMIPAPTEDDPPEVHERYRIISSGQSLGIGGDLYYGYRNDLLSFVSDNIKNLAGINSYEHTELIPGLLQNTMRVDFPVAFAHIDVDWYEPVRYSIQSIWPWVSINGIVIFDDYRDWGGCKKAVDEFFGGQKDFLADISGGNLKIKKIA